MVPKADVRHTSYSPARRGAVLLARHGQTADNSAGRIVGRRDPPLTAVGVGQAERLAASVAAAGLVALWSSPLRRARETAAIVGARIGLEAVVLPDLVESARGRWEGRETALIAREEPLLHAAFVAADPAFAFPGGESLAQQRTRTAAALEAVAAGALPALVVAHAGTIRAALALAGLPVGPESALVHGAVGAELDGSAIRSGA